MRDAIYTGFRLGDIGCSWLYDWIWSVNYSLAIVQTQP